MGRERQAAAEVTSPSYITITIAATINN